MEQETPTQNPPAVHWTGYSGAAPSAEQMRDLASWGWHLLNAGEAQPSPGRRLHLVASDHDEAALVAAVPPGDEVLRLPMDTAVLAARLARWASGQQASIWDPLTGLVNRRGFQQALAEMARRPDVGVTMLALVDVDRFKLINDRYGHTAGDDVLRTLAALLRQWAPQHGVARMGGAEFGLLMHGEDEATLLAELEALMRGVRAQRFAIDATLQVTVSIGVAVAEPGVPFTETTLLQQADTALYRAKALGRDRIEVDAPVSSRSDVHHCELQRFMNATQVYSERMALLMKTFGRRLAERSRQDALHDELTGAFNRRYFNERMAREWAQVTRHGVPLSVVFLDLDNFGQVNRQHGFRNGDAVLKRIVELVGEQIRLSDWLARWGGEEFCVVLPGTPLAEAAEVAQRVRVAVEAAAFALTDGDTLRLTCSLGVASTGTGMNMQDASDLTEAASRAARQAKAAGKNRVVLDSGAG